MADRRHTREDSGLVLDREGRWLHDGEPVEHPKISEAFNRGLERDQDGRYLLRFGGDWCVVTVEDAAAQVLSVIEDGAGLSLELSTGRKEQLRPETLRLRAGVLYCETEGRLAARFSRSAQFTLGSLLSERPGGFILKLSGREWAIGTDDPA